MFYLWIKAYRISDQFNTKMSSDLNLYEVETDFYTKAVYNTFFRLHFTKAWNLCELKLYTFLISIMRNTWFTNLFLRDLIWYLVNTSE